MKPPLRAEDRDAAAVQRRVVDDVEGPNDAVAEPIGRDGELDRHERPAVLVRGLVVVQVDHRWLSGDLLVHRAGRTNEPLADEAREEVVDDGPLVVPARQPARGLEHPFLTHALRPCVIDELVVELDDRLMELDDDQVLVVARVADDGPAIAVTGHVHDTVDVRRQKQLVPVGRIVKGRIIHRPASVDGVEVIARRPEVDFGIRIRLLLIERCGVERDVVVDELPDECEPCEQSRAGVEMVAVRHRLVLDHVLGQVR